MIFKKITPSVKSSQYFIFRSLLMLCECSTWGEMQLPQKTPERNAN